MPIPEMAWSEPLSPGFGGLPPKWKAPLPQLPQTKAATVAPCSESTNAAVAAAAIIITQIVCRRRCRISVPIVPQLPHLFHLLSAKWKVLRSVCNRDVVKCPKKDSCVIGKQIAALSVHTSAEIDKRSRRVCLLCTWTCSFPIG